MAGKDARRAAEELAREALGARVAAVGELGLAAQRRAGAADGPARAREKTGELVAAARAQGRELTRAAQDEIAAADDAYATVYAAAVAAGWSTAELTGFGYPPPARRRSTPRNPGSTPGPGGTDPANSPQDTPGRDVPRTAEQVILPG